MENKIFEQSSEILEVSSLTELAGSLGIIETEKMADLRDEIIESIKDGSEYKDAYMRYEEFAIEKINQFQGEAYAKAQIGLIIIKASMFYKGGDLSNYKEQRNDALEYASNIGYDDIIEAICKITDKEEEKK